MEATYHQELLNWLTPLSTPGHPWKLQMRGEVHKNLYSKTQKRDAQFHISIHGTSSQQSIKNICSHFVSEKKKMLILFENYAYMFFQFTILNVKFTMTTEVGILWLL